MIPGLFLLQLILFHAAFRTAASLVSSASACKINKVILWRKLAQCRSRLGREDTKKYLRWRCYFLEASGLGVGQQRSKIFKAAVRHDGNILLLGWSETDLHYRLFPPYTYLGRREGLSKSMRLGRESTRESSQDWPGERGTSHTALKAKEAGRVGEIGRGF